MDVRSNDPEAVPLNPLNGLRVNRRGQKRFFYLHVVGTILSVLLAVQAIILLVDPYNQFPWSRTHTTFDYSNPIGLGQHFIGQILRGNVDTVVAGGSTAMAFRTDDIKAAFPGTRSVANISYSVPRPVDLGLVIDRLTNAPNVKRILLAIDYSTFAASVTDKNTHFPFALYKHNLIDQFQFFDGVGLAVAIRELTGLELGRALRMEKKFLRDRDAAYKNSLMQPEVRRFASDYENNRKLLPGTGTTSCTKFSLISSALMPLARKLSDNGSRLDLVLPPYNLSFYAYIAGPQAKLPGFLRLATSLDSILNLRRCVVNEMSGLKNVSVYAFEDEKKLVEDMANYYDSSHIYKFEWYKFMLDEIEAGRHRLTRDNVDAYVNDLRSRVLNYKLKNSAVPDEWLVPGHDKPAQSLLRE